jgi:hypothetical protein
LATLLRNVIVAILTALCSTVPLLLLSAFLSGRGFTYSSDGWDEASRRRQVLKWKIKEFVLATILALYSLFLAFFVLVFLSKVSEGTSSQWATTAVFTLLKDVVLMPLGLALLFMLGTKAHSMWDSNALKKVHDRYFHAAHMKVDGHNIVAGKGIASVALKVPDYRDEICVWDSWRKSKQKARPSTARLEPIVPMPPSGRPDEIQMPNPQSD